MPSFKRLDESRWEIRQEGGMRVPGLVFASEALIKDIQSDRSPEQVANVAQLPGILGRSIAMPDMHWGYGFPIGGVAAFDAEEGVLSPGGVGYDINCGVRLLRSRLTEADVRGRVAQIANALYKAVPCGVGSKSPVRLGDEELDAVLTRGAEWAVEAGYGHREDLEVMEEGGRMSGAEVGRVSERARARGKPQLGSLGSGNHFCELQLVDEVYDEASARAFGLERGQVTLMLHSGSRGFGHQVCDESIREMLRASGKYGIVLPDRQLCAAPLQSPEAQAYFGAMACAVNFAFANRQLMTHFAREALGRFYGVEERELGLELVYDVCHNIAKWEEHEVEGQRRRVCVHRKGATRAFGPGHPELPERYQASGQPVLIPGDMGRYSFVLAGTERAMRESFGSACHGAGRRLSRTAARKHMKGQDPVKAMRARGVIVRSPSKKTVAEEVPEAYKDVADVVGVIHEAGLARKVARLRPLAVIKG